MNEPILILDDMIEEARSFQSLLQSYGYKVSLTDTVEAFFSEYEKIEPSLIILDIALREGQPTGLDVLEELQKKPFMPSVIVMSARASRTQVAEIMKYPVYGYIEKGRDYQNLDQFMIQIRNAVEMCVIRRKNIKSLQRTADYQPMLFQSDVMKALYDKAVKYAQTDQNILITGESGVGKEVLAKEIHFLSKRKENPFIAVNSGAIPKELFESEFFGYVKGAFTGALQNNKTGFFEAAHKGTLFLDEISTIPYDLQHKLLRVLQNKRFNRLGDSKNEQYSDFRLICATNFSLPELIRKNQFREDLFNRINTLSIEIPPLRKRQEDLFFLFDYFVRNHPERRYEHSFCYDPQQTDTILRKYSWPGNVRELQKFCSTLIAMHEVIDDQVISKTIGDLMHQGPNSSSHENLTLESLLEMEGLYEASEVFEKLFIERRLKNNHGNIRQTALQIGVELSTLYKKIQKMNIKY